MVTIENIIQESYRFPKNYTTELYLFKTLGESNQKLLFKKLLHERKLGNIEFNRKTLQIVESFSKDQNIKSICFVLSSLLGNSEIQQLKQTLADFICKSINENINELKRIDLCFNKCTGRMAKVKKKPEDWYLFIEGRNYRLQKKRYLEDDVYIEEMGIYINNIFYPFNSNGRTYQTEIIDGQTLYFDYIEIGEKFVRAEYKQDTNDYLITSLYSNLPFCEGTPSPNDCEISGKQFSWCKNTPCYDPNQKNTNHYTDYTLLDFINILEINLDQSGYYLFIGQMNRLNRLIDKLKCVKCKNILRPAREGFFWFHRTSLFKCTNNDCSEKQEIYLSHCNNPKCSNIIDSRISTKCKNGIYICDQCGSCCSKDFYTKIVKKYDKLKLKLPERFATIIANDLAHLEKNEVFCYKCGEQIMANERGDYKCKNCPSLIYWHKRVVRENNKKNHEI